MGSDAQDNPRLFFSYLNLPPEVNLQLNKDFLSVASGKDATNQQIAFGSLQQQKKQLKLFRTREDLYEYLRGEDIKSEMIISLLINPDELNEINPGGETDSEDEDEVEEEDSFYNYHTFKEADVSIIPEQLQSSSPIEGYLLDVEILAHSQTLDNLVFSMTEFFGISTYTATFLKSIILDNTPFDLTKELESLGDAFDLDEEDATLETAAEQIKLLAQTLNYYKKKLLDHVWTNHLHNQNEHIKNLKILGHVEDAFIYSYIHMPEYAQHNTVESFELEKQKLGFISLEFPEQLVPPSLPDTTPKTPSVPLVPQITSLSYHGLITEPSEVDLEQFPVSHGLPLTETDFLTLGDLHGNALKLIYFLIRENIMTGISPEEYQELVTLYKEFVPAQIIIANNKELPEAIQKAKAQLARFDELVGKLVPVNPDSNPSLLLIGDVFSDRGNNDRLTFKVLEQIKKHKIPTKIILSNHDLDFLKLYESGGFDKIVEVCWKNPVELPMGEDFSRSLMNLCELIRLGLVSKAEVISFIEETYLPMLTGFHLNVCPKKKKIEFFSHAPVALSIIPALAQQLDIPYDENTLFAEPENLVVLSQAVNEKLRKVIYDKNLTEYSRQGIGGEPVAKKPKRSPENQTIYSMPLYQLMNDRQKKSVVDPRTYDPLPEDWSANYIHGHDGKGCNSKKLNERAHVFDLDNILGYHERPKGAYTAYYFGNNPEFHAQRVPHKKSAQEAMDTHGFFSQNSSEPAGEKTVQQETQVMGQRSISPSGGKD